MAKTNMSVSELAETWEALFPDAGDRLAIFGPLVDSIAYCKRQGSEAWSISERETGFRLNVGNVEAMTFEWSEVKAEQDPDIDRNISLATLRFLMVGSTCADKVTSSHCSDTEEVSYPVIGQTSWCYTGKFGEALDDGYDPARDEISGYFEKLKSHHQDFLDCAFHTSTGKIRQKSNYAQHNNPAYYEYALSVVEGKIWIPLIQDELREDRAAFNDAILKSLEDSAENRALRMSMANPVPEKIILTTTGFRRNPDVVATALIRAAGKCEACQTPAPFARSSDGTPYLEVHHKIPLSKNGLDTLDNAIAVCPNCHRKAHFG